MAVGILGGSFDPVHRGHVALAEHARLRLGLERVLLLPCADPPHKPDRRLAARFHRLEMLYLAIEDRPGLAICTYEIARGGVRYTIDTLRALKAEGLSPVFLCGSDALADVATWHDHEALLREFDFGVVARIGPSGSAGEIDAPEIVMRRVRPLPPPGASDAGAGGRVFPIDTRVPAVSSRAIRSAFRAHESIGSLVPARVGRYIQRCRLYAENEEGPR